MGIGIVELTGILTVLYLLYYYYFTMRFKFWKDRGVPGSEPVPIFGTMKNAVLCKMSLGDHIKDEYNKHRHYPMFGIFMNRTPILVINDPELIKEVLIKNFSTFCNRINRLFEKIEPLSANLINLEFTRWKPLRTKQTTIFSSGKIKDMFHLMMECANHFEQIIDKNMKKNPIIDCFKLTTRFTTDVIGNCVFGLDMKALEDENSQFHMIGLKFTNLNKWRTFKMRFKQVFPSLYNLLGPIMYDHEINDFFINTMIKTMEYRKKNDIKRGDFVDLLNELKDNSGKLNDIELTDELLTAQAFAFFFAGFDTSSTTISHTLYELALNQPIQDKLREEINEVLKRNNGKLEYEHVKNMKYLQKIISETLRKYPVLSILTRQSIKSFTFSDPKVTIPKDMNVWIPVCGLHQNPEFYENPSTFDPERFDDENVKKRQTATYLPFGDGPRNCIGARFGNIQIKVGIVTVVRSYKMDVCNTTPITYVSNPRRFLLAPKNGIPLKFTKLN